MQLIVECFNVTDRLWLDTANIKRGFKITGFVSKIEGGEVGFINDNLLTAKTDFNIQQAWDDYITETQSDIDNIYSVPSLIDWLVKKDYLTKRLK